MTSLLRVCAVLLLGFFTLSVVPAQNPVPPNSDNKLVRSIRVFDVKSYGAVGDGKTMDTAAITAAIRAANASGGGTVLFPPGVYLTGTFELLSNVTLEVMAGAVIQGSASVTDYANISKYGFAHHYGVDSTGEGDLMGIIVARNAENIGIIGQGAIDGNADSFSDFNKPHFGRDFDPQATRQGAAFEKSMLETSDGPVETKDAGRPGTMIVFTHSRNIVIRDVTFRNAPNWTFHLAFARRAVVTGLHIVNSLLLPNNDGIDCLGCNDVHFSDCDIVAGDDDFAFYAAENVSVSNCSLVSHSAGIRLEDSRYGTFTNLSIHSNRGIGIFERYGHTSNLIFSNITMETQLLFGHWWGKAEPLFISIGPPRDGNKSGEVHDIVFSNIVGEVEGGIVMYGDASSPLRNIYLHDVKLKIRPPRKAVSDMAGGNFDFRWTATKLSEAVFKHDIPALYGRHTDGLQIRNFTVDWADGLPDYFSSAIELEDFARFNLDAFQGRQSPNSGSSPAISLRRGEGVFIRNSTAAPGTTTFLSISEVKGEGLFVENDLRAARQAFLPPANSFHLFGNLMPEKTKTCEAHP